MSELSLRNTMESFLSRAAWIIQKDRMNVEDAVELFFATFERTPEVRSVLLDIASCCGMNPAEVVDTEVVAALLGMLAWRAFWNGQVRIEKSK